MGHFSVRTAILTHGLKMRQRPLVRKKIAQIPQAGFQIHGMILLSVGKPSQNIFQVVLDHQMIPMGTIDHAEHLAAARGWIATTDASLCRP